MIMEAALVLLAGGAVAGFGILDSRRRVRRWKEAAELRGLRVTETSGGMKPWIEATDGIGTVRIGMSAEGARPTRIVVDVSQSAEFRQVTIRPQPLGFVPEIELRDMAFDSELQILGPPLLVSALLDEETRRLLSLVNTQGRLDVSLGEMRANVPDKQAGETLSLLLRLRRRLTSPLHIPRRLAENARKDKVPGVRLHNLLLLLEKLPEAPETAEAIAAVRSDPSPEVRLRAAIELGTRSKGRDILIALAKEMEDDAVSAKALGYVSGFLSFEEKRDLLERAVSRNRRETARSCVKALGFTEDAAAVEVLARALEREHGDLAPVVAGALGETGSPAAEPPLLRALERDQPELQVAAAKALGRVGSAASVLPLKEAAERLPHLRQAARQAVADIQARLEGASPGQLSLAATEAGQLSLADQAGQLSLPGKEEEG